MKIIIFMLVCINLFSSNLEDVNKIRIMIITSNNSVLEEIENYIEKDSFDYYYLKALYYNFNGNYKLSIENIEKINENNNKVKLLLLDNYLQKRAYKKALLLINTEFLLENNDALMKVKKEVEDLIDDSTYISLSLSSLYNDNYLEQKEKNASFGNEISLNMGKTIYIDNKKSLSTFLYNKNEFYYESKEENTNYFDLLVQYKKEGTKINYAFPLELQYKIENSQKSDFDFSIGLQLEKYFDLTSKLSNTIGYKYKIDYDTDDKGNSYFNTLEFSKKSFINSKFKFNYLIEDLEINQVDKYIPKFTFSKDLKRSTLIFNYELEYETYKSSNEENLTNYISLEYIYSLKKNSWNIKSSFEYETLDSNFDNNDYKKNLFSIGLIKEF